MKSCEGDQQKEIVPTTTFQSKQEFSLWRAASREKWGLMHHRFNSSSQVTGPPDVTPLAPHSPHLIAHTQKHPHRCQNQWRQELVKVKKTTKKQKTKRKKKKKTQRRRGESSKIKWTKIGGKVKSEVMQQAHKQFGTRAGNLKGTSTREAAGKDPALLKGCSTLAPLLSQMLTVQVQNRLWSVLRWRGACTMHSASFNRVTHKASQDLLFPHCLSCSLTPFHTEPLTVFWCCQCGQTDKAKPRWLIVSKKNKKKVGREKTQIGE